VKCQGSVKGGSLRGGIGNEEDEGAFRMETQEDCSVRILPNNCPMEICSGISCAEIDRVGVSWKMEISK